jgi:hypothetical protein
VKWPKDPDLADQGRLEAPASIAVSFVSMTTNWEQLADEAMSLPGESRARLADRLVESLDIEGLSSIEQLWLTEAKRRRDEVRSGKVETIRGEDALRKVRESLS